jgi:predicted nucleic acid-binding protein
VSAYFDTSAILKLVLDESGTSSLRALVGEIRQRGEHPTTSWLGETEFRRSGLRHGFAQETTEAALADFEVFEMPRDVFEAAAKFPLRDLRTLDALHVAVALRARSDFFISYDQRQCEAAAFVGLQVVMP